MEKVLKKVIKNDFKTSIKKMVQGLKISFTFFEPRFLQAILYFFVERLFAQILI